MIIGWGLYVGLYAHSVNDLSSLYVFVDDEYLLFFGFLNNLDHHAQGSVGETIIVA